MSCPVTFVNLSAIVNPIVNMKRYRKLLIALLAIAGLYVARETGLDQGLIDAVLEGIVEAADPEVAAPEVE